MRTVWAAADVRKRFRGLYESYQRTDDGRPTTRKATARITKLSADGLIMIGERTSSPWRGYWPLTDAGRAALGQ